jgi:4-amino-4-deoxy-L-arabinose transferase-like glycosyltransferase
LAFLRVFLVALGLAVFAWPALDKPRPRLPLIALLIALTLASRGIRLNAAYLDHHSHRQTDVATIARNFYERDPNILYPQVNWRADASNYIESTFPLVPWLTGLGYRLTGEQRWVGRGLVALFAALEVAALFGLVSLYWGQAAGFFAGLFLALSPMAVFFGRALMDDIPSMALAVAGLWGVAAWARSEIPVGRRGGRPVAGIFDWRLALGLLGVTLALMVKVLAVYIYFPLLVVLWQKYRWRVVREPRAWTIVLLPLLPTAAWYLWARELGWHYLSFGIGAPASNETVSKWGSLAFILSGPFLQRIGSRVLQALLTPAGVIPLIVGMVVAVTRPDEHLAYEVAKEDEEREARRSRRAARQFSCFALFVRLRDFVLQTSFGAGTWIFAAWLLGVLAYVTVSGEAQWIHDYYQLPIGLTLAPFVGLGLAELWRRRLPGQAAALALLVLMAGISARRLPGYYLTQAWIPHAAEVVQAMTAADEPVITLVWDNDPTPLYHIHRPGWTVNYLDPPAVAQVPRYLAMGSRVILVQEPGRPQAAYLADLPWMQKLRLVERGDLYAIYRAP